MKIAFDTNGLYTNQAGVARYVRGLGEALHRVAGPGREVSDLAWPVDNTSFRQPMRAAKTLYRELVWAPYVARRRLAAAAPDLYHETFALGVCPPAGVRHVVTLHDLAVFEQPERYRRWHVLSNRRRILKAARADVLVCVSQFTADRAMALLNLPASQLRVVHNGCDFAAADPGPGRAPEGVELPGEFFLFVGSLEPGKNLSLLREVYALAADRESRLPPLLIVGARWPGVAAEGRPPREWRYLGRQPDEVLVGLYRAALGLVFPSRYEGFGLPVLEAMALGCPVLCSPAASLPEVGGDAVHMVEPEPAAFLAGMRRFASDHAFRDALRERGLRRARRFTWERCAEETLAVYEETPRPRPGAKGAC